MNQAFKNAFGLIMGIYAGCTAVTLAEKLFNLNGSNKEETEEKKEETK